MGGRKRGRSGAGKRSRPSETPAGTDSLGIDLVVGVGLILSTLAVYAQVSGHEFVSYDDFVYVVDNQRVRSGLGVEEIAWAATTLHFSNWHPLTWLSYMLDVSLYGVSPGAMHLGNLALHAANAVLLFGLLRRLTGTRWRPALVAALFALHPLHVESVAWISERKDVLSTFFGLLALHAYAGYARTGSRSRYLLCLSCFALGLTAKPMLVTWPFVLLLLDYWPLGRMPLVDSPGGRVATLWPLVREKLPFFAISLAAAVVTLVAQQRGGAIHDSVDLATRVANAAVACVWYLAKTAWPAGLAPFYPHLQADLPIWKVLGSLALVAATTACALGPLRAHRYPTVGWLFYLGTLVPVIGLVQVGAQATADRYTYVPLIGIFVAVAWGLAALVERAPHLRGSVAAFVAVWLTALGVTAHAQAGRWRDSLTLFEHSVAVTASNPVSLIHYANALQDRGRLDEAIERYRAALALEPDFGDALVSLGNALLRKGDVASATPLFQRALAARPDWDVAHLGLGNARLAAGQLDAALLEFRRAIEISPDLATAHNAAGAALARGGDLVGAIPYFEEALRLRPDLPEARRNLEATRRELRRRSSLPPPGHGG